MTIRMKNPSQYEIWLKKKLITKRTHINNLQMGMSYVFAYNMGDDKTMSLDDVTPMIIVYAVQGAGYVGMNLMGMRRDFREKILLEYTKARAALAEGDNKQLTTLLKNLKRAAYSRSFIKFYQKKHIVSNVIEVTPEDIDKLRKHAF